MNLAAAHLLAVLALLIGPGLLPAFALAGRTPLALAIAPLLTALGCTAAVVVSVLGRLPFGASLALVFAVGLAASVAALVRGRRRAPMRRSVTWPQLGVLASALVLPLQAVRRPPVDWDARAIWLLHADWFRVGGADAVAALGNPVFAPTHPDYPPLAPGTMAGVWAVLGRDFELGQLAVALLIASAILAIGLALCIVVTGVSRALTTAVAAALILAVYGVGGHHATNGYVDVLWAAAFVAAAVCLLLGPRDRDAHVLGALCLAVAMATKNEGMAAGVALLVVVVVARGWRRAVAVGVAPVVLSAAWLLARTVVGAKSDVAESSRFSDLLSGDPVVMDRIGRTAEELWARSRWEILVAALLTAVGVAVARRYRRDLLSAGWASLWVVAAICLGMVGVVYLISPHDLWWYLATSADRTTLAPRMLLVAECAVWMVVLVSERMAARRRAAVPPEPVTEVSPVAEPVLRSSPPPA